jgi:glycosyltransferase involved in cell wall biosynthesis
MGEANLAMGLYFWPRGGSAQVARYLCRALAGGPWAPVLHAGSLGPPGTATNAGTFYEGVRCEPVDYTPAWSAWADGTDPMTAPVPLHASYEDKPDVPDRSFFELDDGAFDRQVDSWCRSFRRRTVPDPAVVHLHHLTPMHAAARLAWPGVPIVTHLHGTELKMLASADRHQRRAGGSFVAEWVGRMQRWASDSDAVVAVSDADHRLARSLLPLGPDRLTTITSGVDTSVFAPRPRDRARSRALWQRLLVEDPRGWRPGGGPGSIRYRAADLDAFTDGAGQPVPVVVFAGRFLAFKRLSLLIEAHHAAQRSCRSVLVVIGGFPGEWEGEHPHDTVQRIGARDVFFAGWRGHGDLAAVLRSADVFAAPSVDEPFGLVYLEAMAAGVPPIAADSGGPPSFINVDPAGPTGWLVTSDDREALTAALVAAVADPADRSARGDRAARFVRDHYSWTATAQAFAALYGRVTSETPGTPAGVLW